MLDMEFLILIRTFSFAINECPTTATMMSPSRSDATVEFKSIAIPDAGGRPTTHHPRPVGV
jgi:hypothetical protein